MRCLLANSKLLIFDSSVPRLFRQSDSALFASLWRLLARWIFEWFSSAVSTFVRSRHLCSNDEGIPSTILLRNILPRIFGWKSWQSEIVFMICIAAVYFHRPMKVILHWWSWCMFQDVWKHIEGRPYFPFFCHNKSRLIWRVVVSEYEWRWRRRRMLTWAGSKWKKERRWITD